MRLTIVAFAALVVSSCTGTGSPPAASPRTSPSASPSAVTAPEVDTRPYLSESDASLHFTSPTGNIVCDLGSESDADFLSCTILKHDWKTGCKVGEYASIELGQSDDELAHLRCGDYLPGENVHVLPYGRSISGINIRCTSTVEGMTCEDTKRPHGRFLMSRTVYRLS